MASREHLVMRKNMSYGLWSSVWSPAKHMLTLEWGGSERLEAEGKTGLHCETELLGRMGTESFLGLQSGYQPSHREVAQPQSLWTAPPIRSSHFVFFDCQDSAFVPWPRSTHLCVVRSGIASACQQVPWQTPKTQTGRSLDTLTVGVLTSQFTSLSSAVVPQDPENSIGHHTRVASWAPSLGSLPQGRSGGSMLKLILRKLSPTSAGLGTRRDTQVSWV